MTKPKAKKAQPTFFLYPHSLGDETKKRLAELLGNDDYQAILDVEITLSLGTDGAVHLDDIPRPADYVSAFRPISKDAVRLVNALMGLGGYFSEEFTKRGVNQDAIETQLLSLLSVSEAVIGEYKAKPSKGAKKNNALSEVIDRLRGIFWKYYKGLKGQRKSKNGFQSLSEDERSEGEFVKVALLDARIIPQNFNDLPRLIRQSRERQAK